MSAGETFRDAEAWLRARGVERRTLVDLTVDPAATSPDDETVSDEPARPDVSVAEARRLVDEAPTPVAPTADDQQSAPPPGPLGDAVAAALATALRITEAAPCSEGRLRRKLEERDHPAVVVDEVLSRARAQRLVDDDALAASLVAEWRAKGHAPRRLRDDLRKREFDEDVITRATAVAVAEDPGAAAFDLARGRAEKLRHVAAETALRRTTAFLIRRGYGDGLARKAARDAVYDDRERERVAGH